MDTTFSYAQIERAVILLRGVPIGAAWLGDGDVVLATLETNAAFEGVAHEVQRASARLWALGFLAPDGPRIPVEALAPPLDLAFELRDSSGAGLHADFVNVVASPRSSEPPVVVVCRKYAHAAVASILRASRRHAGDAQ